METWRLRREDRLRREAEAANSAFQIDRDFERSERRRLDLPGVGEDSYHFTWWDDVKYPLWFFGCIIGFIGFVALFLYSWLA